jgi:sugar phosphate isomerase/epimerase
MQPSSRRHFLKAGAVGAAAFALPSVSLATRRRNSAPGESPVRLGVATYSLRNFSRTEMIAMVQAMGSRYVCLKSMHMPYESSAEEFAAARQEIAAAGLEIVGGGNNNLHVDTDEGVGVFFEYARNAGMPLLVIAPKPEVLPRIEKFVKQYDIQVAIHNHGPEDEYFPAPSDALKLIKDMDPRVGICVDVGHTTRTGRDVVQEIVDAGPRVLDVHLKDLKDLMVSRSQCNVGHGAMPIPEIFRALEQIDFQGYANLEYEINASDPLAGMVESFAYMRGVLAGMSLA